MRDGSEQSSIAWLCGGRRAIPPGVTGNRDAFVAAMLIGILEQRADYAAHLPEALDFANAVGALTCLKEGAIPSLPTMAEARTFMAARRR